MPILLARMLLRFSSDVRLCSRTCCKQGDHFYFLRVACPSSTPIATPVPEPGKVEARIRAFFLFIAWLHFISGVKCIITMY